MHFYMTFTCVNICALFKECKLTELSLNVNQASAKQRVEVHCHGKSKARSLSKMSVITSVTNTD